MFPITFIDPRELVEIAYFAGNLNRNLARIETRHAPNAAPAGQSGIRKGSVTNPVRTHRTHSCDHNPSLQWLTVDIHFLRVEFRYADCRPQPAPRQFVLRKSLLKESPFSLTASLLCHPSSQTSHFRVLSRRSGDLPLPQLHPRND